MAGDGLGGEAVLLGGRGARAEGEEEGDGREVVVGRGEVERGRACDEWGQGQDLATTGRAVAPLGRASRFESSGLTCGSDSES